MITCEGIGHVEVTAQIISWLHMRELVMLRWLLAVYRASWNRLRHVGVLPVLMTVSQLEQFETCWCAANAHDIVSVGTVWDMLVCCQCSWHCISWNSLRHVGVLPVLMTLSQLEQFQTCWCAASAHDSVSVGTGWDMLVCCQCSWQCLSWNMLRHLMWFWPCIVVNMWK